MADYLDNIQEGLVIDFNNKLYQSSEFSLYEASDSSIDGRLIVLIVTGARVASASPEIARKIHEACDKVNSLARSHSSLSEILESGVTGQFQPFFVSHFPEGNTLASSPPKSLEDGLERLEKIAYIVGLVHQSSFVQAAINLEAEWYEDGSDVILLFPGLRSILRGVIDWRRSTEVLNPKNLNKFLFLDDGFTQGRDLRLLVEMLDALFNEYFQDILESSAISEINQDIKELYELIDNEPAFSISNFIEILKNIKLLALASLVDLRSSSHSQKNDYSRLITDDNEFNPEPHRLPTPEVETFQMEDEFEPQSDSIASRFSSKAQEVFGSESFKVGSNRSKHKVIISSFIVLFIVALILKFSFSSSDTVAPYVTDLQKDMASFDDSLDNSKSMIDADSREIDYLANEKSLSKRFLEDEIEDIKREREEAIEEELTSDIKDKVTEILEEDETSLSSDLSEVETAITSIVPKQAPDIKVESLLDPELKEIKLEKDKSKSTTSFVKDDLMSSDVIQANKMKPKDIKDFLESLPRPIPETELSRVLGVLESNEFDLRIAAVRVLGERAAPRNPQVRNAIISMLKDEDVLVRGFAGFALVAYSGVEAAPVLKDFEKTEKSEVVRSAYNRAIARVK